MGSTYLLDEYPLIVLPTLACAVGLNEAIVLQQINYWINNPKIGKMYDGLRWVRNSMEQWRKENFPFYSMPTLKRIMASLDDQQLIFKTIALNENPYDKTLWYTLNKPTLLLIVSEYQNDTIEEINVIPSTSDQNDTLVSIKAIHSNTDNTSDITDNTSRKRKRDLFFDLIVESYLCTDLKDKDAVKLIGSYAGKLERQCKEKGLSLEELTTVAAWLNETRPGLNMPTGIDSICRAVKDYRAAVKPSGNGHTAPTFVDPNDPTLPENDWIAPSQDETYE